jgi:hypothetical protein
VGTKLKKFYIERMIWRGVRWVYKVFCEEHKEGQGCYEILKEIRVGVGFVVKERGRYLNKQGLRMLLVKRWILGKKITCIGGRQLGEVSFCFDKHFEFPQEFLL